MGVKNIVVPDRIIEGVRMRCHVIDCKTTNNQKVISIESRDLMEVFIRSEFKLDDTVKIEVAIQSHICLDSNIVVQTSEWHNRQYDNKLDSTYKMADVPHYAVIVFGMDIAVISPHLIEGLKDTCFVCTVVPLCQTIRNPVIIGDTTTLE